jgi:hypothetical protein
MTWTRIFNAKETNMPGFSVERDMKDPVVKAALDAMSALSKHPSEVYGAMADAFALTVCESRRNQYAKRLGAKLRQDAHVCTHRLIRGGKCPDTWEKPCQSPMDLPGCDHLKEWHNGEETVSIVSEPYSLSLDDLRKIATYADAHNLDVSITATDASHFPGETLHLEWTRREGS